MAKCTVRTRGTIIVMSPGEGMQRNMLTEPEPLKYNICGLVVAILSLSIQFHFDRLKTKLIVYHAPFFAKTVCSRKFT